MKHKSVAISFDDLFTRVDRDTDTPMNETIGIETDWEFLGIDDPMEQIRNYNDLNSGQAIFGLGCYERLKDSWFCVSWPEHVLTPVYNSDAYYSGPMTREEAVSDADLIYGE